MASSYTDLNTYRACPRLLAFNKLEYRLAKMSEPINTGTLFHAGITAKFRNESPDLAMDAICEKLWRNIKEDFEAQAELAEARQRAGKMLGRYIKTLARDFTPIDTELRLELDGVVCHIDLIAVRDQELVLVDYKTSYQPDIRWYDISGQLDLYAYIYRREEKREVSWVLYDCVSDDKIIRHQRPPREWAGAKLWNAVKAISKIPTEELLDTHHPTYTCPSRCAFFVPCWLLETADKGACMDYLESNFVKGVGRK